MTKTYHARLSLEATVPEQPMLEPFLKASVEFQVWCPKCGPNWNCIKKDGFDKKHSAQPQLFYCNRHKINFYAHTSWVCTQLTEITFERIVSDLFERRLDAKAVSVIHDISPSIISQIRNCFTQALDWKLNQLAQKREILQKIPKLPVPLDNAIYWDETFFRIGSSSWALILLIDAQGKPLVWRFSKKRNASVYQELIQIILAQLPSVPIFIGDGWNAYQKVCLELSRECFLIEHLHSHPWQFARIHHYIISPKTDFTTQNSIEIPYKSFLNNKPIVGHTIKRKHKKIDPNSIPKKRGRPLGCKDKQKRHSKNFPKLPKPKRKLKKRGKKSIRKDGFPFSFHPQPIPVGWKIEWIKEGNNDSQCVAPPISEIELLLDMSYKVMNGKSIQSNKIESKNRLLKDLTPTRGFKTPLQLKEHLSRHLHFWSNTINIPISQKLPSVPLRSSTGFARLFTFFQPKIELIQIRSG